MPGLGHGTRYVLAGYEDSGMSGVPGEVLERAGARRRMEGWHFVGHFVVMKIVQPTGGAPSAPDP
jgi:hypothetical protein